MASPSPVLADRIVRPNAQTGFDLYIYSMYEKPGWQTRKAGDQIRSAHPGSAVDFDGQLYEVMDVGPGEGTSFTYRYALRRWDDKHVVRRIFPYTAAIQHAVATGILERREQHRRHSWLIWLFPISGAFPTQLLQRWQLEWGLPMYGAALASSIALGLPCLALFAYVLREGHTVAAAVLLYVGLEQFIRGLWTLFTGTPRGSLVLTVGWSLLHPGGGKRRLAYDFSDRDEVRYLRDQPWDVEVRSLFRDPALCGDALVTVEGDTYRPLGYVVVGEGLYRRYSFRLQRMEEGQQAARAYQRYRTPEQAAALIDYENARSRVNSLELLYGFLPAKRQLELEKKYDFLSARATAYSAILMLAATALKFFTLAIGDKFDYSFVLAIYFVIESIYRISVSQSRAEPAGSLFGWVLSPFLRS